MHRSTIYSIGHGHKTIKEFIAELKSFDIQYLIDVRTSPYSKWAPQFNKETIKEWLPKDIKYTYFGDSMGGKPQNNACYDKDGYLDYQKMAEIPTFQAGLNRLVDANNLHLNVAIMCTESDPAQCHRSKLIGRELFFRHEIDVSHILENGKTISQSSIMTELTDGQWLERNLFDNNDNNNGPYFKSCKAYKNIDSYPEDYTMIYD